VNDSQQEKADLNVSLYDMLGALQKLLRRKKLQRPLSAKVARQEIPIEKRMSEIVDQLRNFKGRKKFTDLFPISDREHIVVTFLAVLELIKRKEIQVEQDRNFSDIFVASMEGDK
jgi:segregation and condensation protein A